MSEPECTIELAETIPTEVADQVDRGHEQYESNHGVVCGYRNFYLIARSTSGDAIGVLAAYTAYSEIYVEDLWVDAEHRKRGIGRVLLGSLESRFSGKGYNNINLVTNAFQAVGFYRKCGYEVEFERVNRMNPKLSKTFLIKYFDDAVQRRGMCN